VYEFQFGKKDEKLFKEIVDTYMKIDMDVNIRNNLLSRIRIALMKNRND